MFSNPSLYRNFEAIYLHNRETPLRAERVEATGNILLDILIERGFVVVDDCRFKLSSLFIVLGFLFRQQKLFSEKVISEIAGTGDFNLQC